MWALYEWSGMARLAVDQRLSAEPLPVNYGIAVYPRFRRRLGCRKRRAIKDPRIVADPRFVFYLGVAVYPRIAAGDGLIGNPGIAAVLVKIAFCGNITAQIPGFNIAEIFKRADAIKRLAGKVDSLIFQQLVLELRAPCVKNDLIRSCHPPDA